MKVFFGSFYSVKDIYSAFVAYGTRVCENLAVCAYSSQRRYDDDDKFEVAIIICELLTYNWNHA